MYRQFTHYDNTVYIDTLQDLVNAYNKQYHRSIGCKPIEVNKTNEREIWHRLYSDVAMKDEKSPIPQKKIILKFKVGQFVRITKEKSIFEKGYLQNFTDEVFVIKKTLPLGVAQYVLEDIDGEVIKGKFYQDELQRVYIRKFPNFKNVKVDHVYKERKKNGKKQVLVKFKGFDDHHNNWIDKRYINKSVL